MKEYEKNGNTDDIKYIIKKNNNIEKRSKN